MLMKTYYHVTPVENLGSIQKNGLVPRIGTLAEECGEEKERIYLFPDRNAMDTALGSWLGEWYDGTYGEDYPLCSLCITLPDDFPVEPGEVEYECYSNIRIPPEYIHFLQYEQEMDDTEPDKNI